MGIFDKAKDMIKGKEKHADTAVDRAGDMVDQHTGGQHTEQVDRGKDFVQQQYGGGQAADPVEPAPGQNPDLTPGGIGQQDLSQGAGVDGAPTDQSFGQHEAGFDQHNPLDQRAGDPTPGQEGMGLGSPDGEPGFGDQGQPR